MTRTITSTGLITAIRGCASWQDIQAKWRMLPEKQKGDLFEELVKAYLQLDPEYGRRFPALEWQSLPPNPGAFPRSLISLLPKADASSRQKRTLTSQKNAS